MKGNTFRISGREILYHLLFWIVYVASEYFANLMHMQSGRNLRFFQSILLTLPALMLPAYFMAWYVVPRYLRTERWGIFLLWILAIAFFIFFGRIKWAELVNYLQSGTYYEIPVSKMLKNIIRDYSIIALGVCIYIIGDYRKNQKHNEQLIKAKAETEIKLLKGQLHPHFLFNSLNNIYGLALMKSDLTAESILKLTELLDYLVYRASMDRVALSREVQLLQNYIELEKLRYGDNLKIDAELKNLYDGVMVAPLILLPFAENCFKHGGPGADHVFRINIKLDADEHGLLFEIANTKRIKSEKTSVSGGVGLENIRQRLILLYPDQHKLIIQDTPELYAVSLKIYFNNGKV